MTDTPDPDSLPVQGTESETPDDTPDIGGGPVLSLGEAVKTTGAARTTIQRRLARGEIPGATRTPSGGWSIPVRGLIAAGLTPRTSPPDAAPVRSVEEETAELRAELAAAQAAAERYRVEAEAATRLAEERAAGLADLRLALKAMSQAIESGERPRPAIPLTEHAPSSVMPPAEISQDLGVATPTAPRRRWWQR
jgi:hypothetical protein